MMKLSIPYNNLTPAMSLAAREIKTAMQLVFFSSSYILGTELEKFEEALAKELGFKHAVGVASGTDALVLSLMTLGIKPGDKVMTVANSAPATVSAIRQAGGIPIFTDVDNNGLIDIKLVTRERIKGVKFFVPVHLYGQMINLTPLWELFQDANVQVVEDACQAYGSHTHGYGLGGLSEFSLTCLSFYPTKNLGAMGDGGAVLTNSAEQRDELRRLRNYGLEDDKIKKYGLNSRLDEMQAAILHARMPTIDEIAHRKIELSLRYCETLDAVKNYIRCVEPEIGDNGHIFATFCEDRDHLKKYLLDKHGIGTRIHYPIAAHKQPVEVAWTRLPKTEELIARELSFPNWYGMTDDHVRSIARAVRTFYGK